MKKTILRIAGLLAVAGLCFSCVPIGNEDPAPTSVNAAFQIRVTGIEANEANVAFITDQDNIASYCVVGPILATEINYLAMDAITRKNYLEAAGEMAEAPFSKRITGMKATTAYVMGGIGYDKSGTAVTAPTFLTFTTKSLEANIKLSVVKEAEFDYEASAAITLGAGVKKFNYIFDMENVGKTDTELKAILTASGVKSATESSTLTLKSAKAGKFICAILPFDSNDAPGKVVKEIGNFNPVVGSNVNYIIIEGEPKELLETSTGVFEGTFAFPAKCEFEAVFKGVKYGFAPFSGNGGIGTVENLNSAMPYYSNYGDPDRFVYTCAKANGTMKEIVDGTDTGVPFWTNLAAAGDVYLRFTFADGKAPVYYIRSAAPADPAIVFQENFDLFTNGGAYWESSSLGAGTKPNVTTAFATGVEPGTKGGATYTKTGAMDDTFSYGVADDGVITMASDEYIANRDMQGWQFKSVAEVAGAVRIAKSSTTNDAYKGYFITPALSAVSGSVNATLSFDCLRFGGADNIIVELQNAGTYTAAKVNIDGSATVTSVDASGTQFIITPALCSKMDNAVVHKGWSHVELSVSGITAETKILFDGMQAANAKEGRIIIDNILVKK